MYEASLCLLNIVIGGKMDKDYKEASRRVKEAWDKENEFLKEDVIGRVKENQTSPQNNQTQTEKATEDRED